MIKLMLVAMALPLMPITAGVVVAVREVQQRIRLRTIYKDSIQRNLLARDAKASKADTHHMIHIPTTPSVSSEEIGTMVAEYATEVKATVVLAIRAVATRVLEATKVEGK